MASFVAFTTRLSACLSVWQLSGGEDDHGALPSQQGAGHGPPGVL